MPQFIHYILGVALLATLMVLSIAFGSTPIEAGDILAAIGRSLGIWDGESGPIDRIIIDLRTPRTLFAAIIGAGLGLVGALLQTVTRNDLADPFLFGLSSGAATGAVFVITVTGDLLGTWTLPLAAFLGGMLASLTVLALVQKLGNTNPEKLILAGLAVSFLFSAATNYLVFAGDHRAAHSVIFWMLGGLGLARWSSLALLLLGFGVLVGFAAFNHRKLDALLAGDMTAESLGVSVTSTRKNVFLICAFATAIFVSIAGVIGFVGLMVPHISRAFAGRLHAPLFLSCTIIGALLLTASDLIARLLLAPQELPVGVITTSLGALFVFIMLMKKRLY
ncbi:MAG: iron ABC transporter permease [Cohaesibacter sp.]|jgi:iron complex transport system permease protein|nr:iron ABC transporter permease [Cohaesibacter sp.]